MRRVIKAEIIVESGENSNFSLIEAACKYLEGRGFKAAVPHMYPEEPLVIEFSETIPVIRP